MRARTQRGASLLIVLALVTFLGILIPAVLGLALTGSKVTVPVLEDRRELYAASSAIDAAVQQGREDPDIGVPGGPCPTKVVTIDGFDVTVACQQHAPPLDGCRYLDRFVTYTAEVREPGDATVIGRLAAEAVYRFNVATGVPTVDVRQWNPDAGGPVPTTALPACVSTTTTTPTTTTSTTVPVAGIYAKWENPLPEQVNSNWRAEGTVAVTDQNGVALEGVEVTVRPAYLPENGTFTDDTPLSGFTTDTGVVTFYSDLYRRTGSNKVTQVKMTITAVAGLNGLTWIDTAHSPELIVNAP